MIPGFGHSEVVIIYPDSTPVDVGVNFKNITGTGPIGWENRWTLAMDSPWIHWSSWFMSDSNDLSTTTGGHTLPWPPPDPELRLPHCPPRCLPQCQSGEPERIKKATPGWVWCSSGWPEKMTYGWPENSWKFLKIRDPKSRWNIGILLLMIGEITKMMGAFRSFSTCKTAETETGSGCRDHHSVQNTDIQLTSSWFHLHQLLGLFLGFPSWLKFIRP